MDQNMIKAAMKTWRLLRERGKVKKYKGKKPTTITITFIGGEYWLIDAVLKELEKERGV